MRIVTAMSGGVDSAAAAHLLREAGHEVIGLTLRLWRASRLSEDYIDRAAAVAAALGIPHHVADVRDAFERVVVDPFCAEYLAGRTPNPCILCNPRIKAAALIEQADRLGAAKVATGHYARIVEREGRHELRRGVDPDKDQSYVLHRLTPDQLARLVLPLGDRVKADIRALVRAFWPWPELPEESQEVCFLPKGGHPAFIRERLGLAPSAGRVVDTAGNVLARHDGIHRFTIGQRHGLGFAAGRPMYVLRIEPETNTIVVGERDETYGARFRVRDLTWCSVDPPGGPFRADVQIRYTHPAAPALVTPDADGAAVAFDAPQHAVTPGQSAVFYGGDLVLGGGIIDRITDPSEPEGERLDRAN